MPAIMDSMSYVNLSTDLSDVKIQIALRVPVPYRDQLANEAARRRMSLNALLVEALMKQIPPRPAT